MELLADMLSKRVDENQHAPASWLMVPVLATLKKYQQTIHNDHFRGSSIAAQTYKLYMHVVMKKAEDRLDENYMLQFGSKKHTQPSELVLLTRIVIEKCQ